MSSPWLFLSFDWRTLCSGSQLIKGNWGPVTIPCSTMALHWVSVLSLQRKKVERPCCKSSTVITVPLWHVKVLAELSLINIINVKLSWEIIYITNPTCRHFIKKVNKCLFSPQILTASHPFGRKQWLTRDFQLWRQGTLMADGVQVISKLRN